MNIYALLEWTGVSLWVVYLFLATQERIECWIFGILASGVTIFNFYHSKIYSEAVLNVYYIGAAIYGWYYWTESRRRAGSSTTPVVVWSAKKHVILYVITAAFAYVLGRVLSAYTDSPRPYIDACTASFSFLTTFMEARKVLTTWINWCLINLVLVYLQIDRGLPVYAGLSAFFALMSIRGFYKWRKTYLANA